ncbi:MAG: arylsulfatase [Saprospiraceae bacterium]|nr:arylsulfatase [Saprospiraceae bacterium]
MKNAQLRPFLFYILGLLVGLSACQEAETTAIPPASSSKAAGSKPNIILYLADDLGWGDLGCYGQQKIPTPHLDRLALNGIRFTDAYCGSPVCASSRSTLLQGLHAGHARVRNNRSIDKQEVDLVDSDYTMAEMLKSAGYATGLFGKWGLGNEGGTGIPNLQGFDEFWGFLNQRRAHYYYVDSLWHNQAKIPVPLDEKAQYASADWYFDKAKDFIKRESQTDRPFFTYIPTQLPHLYMPYEPWEIYQDKPWPEGDKRWASMISTIDAQIGELMELVDSLGLAEETIILFLSDNGGGSGERIFYHDVRFFKSNGDFKGTKRDLYEGGIRVPLLMQWKDVIPAQKVSAEPVAYYDLMTTLGELAGVEVPQTDGESLVDLLTGTTDNLERDYLYWEFPYMDQANSKFAVRKGKWKGVKEWEGAKLRLYNLAEDPQELYNWAKEYPQIAAELEKIITREHTPSPFWPLKSELK